MYGVLFVCDGNATRSPMAEAIGRHLGPLYAPRAEFWSAGPHPTHVRPQVRQVLAESGIEPGGLRSKGIFEVPLDEVRLVVNLSRLAVLPALPNAQSRVEWPLPDPSSAPPEDTLEAYRATRDELLRRLPDLLRDFRPHPK